MSISTTETTSITSRSLSSLVSGDTTVSTTWVRNSLWPTLTAPLSTDQKFVGLYAVWPGDGVGFGGNFFAVTCAGAYTVNYGDGTTTNTTSGETNQKEYDFNDVDLYDATVTLTDSGDLVTRTAHNLSNNEIVRFYRIATTTGLSEEQVYYVINATANTFQVSTTISGSAVALTSDGSASLLPYKIATVTITPQAGQNLTSINLLVRNTTPVVPHSTGWLDIAVAGSNITTLTISTESGGSVVFHNYLERVNIVKLGNVTSFAGLFGNCRTLRNVSIEPPSTVTNMSGMFNSCSSLTTVPLFNTAAVTNMSSMFTSCFSLTTVPLFNTAAVTTMSSMFNSCSSLTTVPLFNTAAVTNMSSMFSNCSSLTTVPLFNTAAVTNMSSMFSNCSSLTTVPLFNTAAVTSMSSMFNGCSSLTTVPLFNTAAVTTMSNMFNSCRALTSIPLFNTEKVTTMSGMFNTCISISKIPAINTTAVSSSTNFTNMFNNAGSLSRMQAKNFRFTFNIQSCKLSANALNEIYTNLPTVVNETITVSFNYGTATDNTAIATSKGWSVTS